MSDNVTPIKSVDEAQDRSAEAKKNPPKTPDAKDTTPKAEGKEQGKDPAKPTPTAAQKELEALRARAKSAEDKVHELNKKISAQNVPGLAQPAKMKTRHWGVIASFFAVVLLPLGIVIAYLFVVAEDQYVSTAGFTVRSQDGPTSSDLLGGLVQFSGSGTGADSDILYEFIQSQEIAQEINEELNIVGHYSAHWPQDWAFSIWPDATSEDLTWFWQRIVNVAYDSGSGLTQVQVVAYDRDMAQAINRAIVTHSQNRINILNEQARADAMRYATADVEDALERLKEAREALVQFRTRTRIVDPAADIQGRMGVMNNLQQQLAQALVEYDLLQGTVNAGDPRLATADRRIQVIRERIDQERTSFAEEDTVANGGAGETYPALISEFERLHVDLEFAEQTYRVALSSLELARDEATRQSRYLATYINPTRAEESEYPQRYLITALAGLFLLMGWSIAILIYYSVRDRR